MIIDFPLPRIPNLATLVTTLRKNYWTDLNRYEQNLVRSAERRLMSGEDRSEHLESLHKLYLKVRNEIPE